MSPTTLKFLADLKKNNNRDWFEKNRNRYEDARADVAAMVEQFLKAFAKHEPSLAGLSAKDCLFRIYRDARFSKNKSPYKTNMGAYISPGGKKAVAPGYYLHIEPGGSFIAGGMWMPPAEELRKIRQEIDYNGKDLKKILSSKAFKSCYDGLDEEHKLKTTPKGYAKDHPDIELLKLTSFIAWHSINDKEVTSPSLNKLLVNSAKALIPFNRFLATAIS